MSDEYTETAERRRSMNWRRLMDFTPSASLIALVLSLLSFYRSYFYVSQQLDVTVTEVSYGTNRGELYMTVAFSNAGNRDAAILRVEPALWAKGSGNAFEWKALYEQVAPELPVVSPRTPMVVKSGGVEVMSLSTLLSATEAETALVKESGGAFIGVRVATMNSDGNLYLIEHPVARLMMDEKNRILSANPTIDRSLLGFSDLKVIPPGNTVTANKKTPFVWAEEHYR